MSCNPSCIRAISPGIARPINLGVIENCRKMCSELCIRCGAVVQLEISYNAIVGQIVYPVRKSSTIGNELSVMCVASDSVICLQSVLSSIARRECDQ